MNRFNALFVASVLALASGCDKDSTTGQNNPPPAPSPVPAKPATADAEGDDHDHGDGDVHTGEKHDLGKQEAGGYSVTATQFGELAGGGEGVFELAVTGGAAKPTAVRAWVGTEDAEGSTKTKGEAEGDDYDVHVELPATLAPESKLWVELDTAAGSQKVSFDLPKGGHDDHDEEGEKKAG
jgi:hypothetical protein